MGSERKPFPSVLLLLLSALGFSSSIFISMGLVIGPQFLQEAPSSAVQALTLRSAAAFALLIAFLHLPALVYAHRDLRKKDGTPLHSSLFKPASSAMILWPAVMIAGFFASRSEAARSFLPALTVLGTAIPLWWQVEYSRRNLPRSTALREGGSLTVALTATPLTIMIVEILLIIMLGLIVLFALSTQPGFTDKLPALIQDMERYLSQGNMEGLQEMLYQWAQNPTLAAASLFAIGLVAPFVEELFKPMATWFLLRQPLKPHEGFSLGLISGGAFALLESAGVVSQIRAQDWLAAISLRAVTGMLHISLSGMVGYGLAKTWNARNYAKASLYLLAATGLHGAWNTLALINGFSTSLIPTTPQSGVAGITSAVTIALMIMVLASVIYITLRINRTLRNEVN